MTHDRESRKNTPLYSGVLKYFPLALAAVARVSKAGNDVHNPGEPIHWSRGKSNDHLDSAARHLTDAGKGEIDPDTNETADAHLAWRALANLEIVEEKRITAQAEKTVHQIGVLWSEADPYPRAWEKIIENKPFVPSPTESWDATVGYAEPPRPELHEIEKELQKIYPPMFSDKERRDFELANPGLLLSADALITERPAVAPFHVAPKPFFWYFATPYTKFPGGFDEAFNLACEGASRLMDAGVPVFSPIAHTHPIAEFMSDADKVDHHLWMAMDGPIMVAAGGLIVFEMASWEESKGMAEEIKRFQAAGKPVVYWKPYAPIPEAITDTAVV